MIKDAKFKKLLVYDKRSKSRKFREKYYNIYLTTIIFVLGWLLVDDFSFILRHRQLFDKNTNLGLRPKLWGFFDLQTPFVTRNQPFFRSYPTDHPWFSLLNSGTLENDCHYLVFHTTVTRAGLELTTFRLWSDRCTTRATASGWWRRVLNIDNSRGGVWQTCSTYRHCVTWEIDN
jgi:hypothetical protein